MNQSLFESSATNDWPADALSTARSVIAGLPLPCLLIWGEESFLFFNDRFLHLTASFFSVPLRQAEKAENVLGAAWSLLSPLIHRVIGTGKAAFVEKAVFPFLEEDFEVGDLEPISDGGGKICGVLVSFVAKAGTASDLANQKSIEQALRIARDELEVQRRLYDAITGSTPDLVYVFDLDYKFVYANRALLTMWGRSWEDSMGKSLLAVGYEPWHAEMHEREIDQVAATKKPIRGEVSFPHATLGKRIYDYIFAPILNEEGEVELIAGTTRDISDLKLTEEALKQSEEELRALSESLERSVAERTKELQRSNEDLLQFAHVASHDLKEPVRKIKTFLNRLNEDRGSTLSPSGQKFIAKINSAADRMYQMIDGVLRYSKIGNLQQDMTQVDLHQLFLQIETDLEVTIQEQNASLRYSELPVIEGAPVLIYQLFYNLINNSLKFAKKEEPVRVNVKAGVVMRENKSFAMIEVSDNGIGFPQEYAETIFNSFTRLNTKDQYEGTGLGLALCKKIVERHGGTITATAAINEGALFSICLPVKQQA